MKQLMWIILAAFVLAISSAANGTPGDILVAGEGGADVYDAPSSAAQVLMTVNEGRKLKELKREGLWIKVIIYGEIGKDGWVHSSGVAPESTGSGKAAKPDISADTSTEPLEISPAPDFILVVTGSLQEPFRVRCQTIDDERVRRTVEFVGRSPNTYTLEGRAVRCRIHRLAGYPGMLGAALHQQGRSKPIGAAQTKASGGCINVRSKGRWGGAWGQGKCSRRVSY